jgi:putative membrane protein
VVNRSVSNGGLHYGMHLALVLTNLAMWMCICGPIKEWRISLPGQMVYLFLMSVVPTVPGAWLTFAEGAVYKAYDIPARMFDISVTQDQQAAGLIMKLIGGSYLWAIITVKFFQWASRHEKAHEAGTLVSERDVLTWDEVQAEFDRLGPAPADKA